ncbi:MAG: hypothetical protein ACI4JM_02470, partial [Oscillospiraceae bacterium]
NGGVGACPRPSIVPKKFFGNLFIKKGWAAESRLMKFPVNHNGRPLVAPLLFCLFESQSFTQTY